MAVLPSPLVGSERERSSAAGGSRRSLEPERSEGQSGERGGNLAAWFPLSPTPLPPGERGSEASYRGGLCQGLGRRGPEPRLDGSPALRIPIRPWRTALRRSMARAAVPRKRAICLRPRPSRTALRRSMARAAVPRKRAICLRPRPSRTALRRSMARAAVPRKRAICLRPRPSRTALRRSMARAAVPRNRAISPPIPAQTGCSQIRVHISPNRRLACQGQDSCSGRISSIPPSVTRATAKLKL